MIRKARRNIKNKCEFCDFCTEGNRKYELIQLFLKHKESCFSNKVNTTARNRNCSDCDFDGKDETNMKRHNRDKHDILTVSTSPPPKKKKNSLHITDIDEDMEIDAKDDIEKLSFKVDEMEIDDEEDDPIVTNEEKQKNERSDNIDANIKEKERKDDERESLFHDKQENTLKKKKKACDLKAEKAKLIRKKSKQATKDFKKKERKRKQSIQIHSPNIKRKLKFPNLRDIPESCKHLVNK